jgi:tetratricopeptide (TPR) repeat protein
MDRGEAHQYDLFVSHAHEDKAEVVEPLVAALQERGLQVWYDDQQITLGDDFRRQIEHGLAHSRFGVVVLSPSFAKYWTEAELSALYGLESVLGSKRILPVRHQLMPQQVTLQWPLLATRASVSTADGITGVAEEIAAVVRGAPPPAAASRMYNVPLASQAFVGREVELEQLAQMLGGSDSVRVTASVEGLAGVGKSELALQLAYRLAGAGAFGGGIFWVDAEHPDLTGTWGGVIADQLGLAPMLVAERAALAVSQLSRGAAPLLVILDNVEVWSGKQQPAPLPNGAHVRLLLTTRQRNLGGNRFRHLPLGFLTDEFARQLLVTLSRREPEDLPGLDELLGYLGGHALAVELAGVYLGELSEETPLGYLERLRRGERPAAEVSELVRYEATAHQAFQAIWDHLELPVRKAWQVAACFAPEERSSALLDACGVGSRLRRDLARYHLLEAAGPGRWRMHRLIHDFGRRSGTSDEQQAANEAFIRGCVKHADEIDIADGFRIYLPDRPHLDLAVQRATEVLGDDDPEVSELLDRVGAALYSMGDLLEARHLREQALASDLQNLGESHPSVAIRQSNLAGVLQDLGQPERARDLLEQALASALQNLGESHPSVAIRRSNLARVLKELGQLEQARDLLEQALASDLENLGESHPNVATRQANLAGVLKDLGHLERARDLLEQALASDLRNLGESHPNVATNRFNLAAISEAERAWQDAEVQYRHAMESYNQALGHSHPYVAYARARLARVLVKLGKPEQAAVEASLALEVASGQPPESRYRRLIEQTLIGIVDHQPGHDEPALPSDLSEGS